MAVKSSRQKVFVLLWGGQGVGYLHMLCRIIPHHLVSQLATTTTVHQLRATATRQQPSVLIDKEDFCLRKTHSLEITLMSFAVGRNNNVSLCSRWLGASACMWTPHSLCAQIFNSLCGKDKMTFTRWFINSYSVVGRATGGVRSTGQRPMNGCPAALPKSSLCHSGQKDSHKTLICSSSLPH